MPGAQGPSGPPGASTVAAFSARLTGYSGLMSPAFGSAIGSSSVNANEDLVETLSPGAALSAMNLAVQSTSAPGIGNTMTVTLRDDGADTALSCTISGGATSCLDLGNSPSIAAGSTLSLEVTSTIGVAATSLLAGFQTQ